MQMSPIEPESSLFTLTADFLIRVE